MHEQAHGEMPTMPGTEENEVFFNYFNEIGIISQLASSLFEASLPDRLTRSQFSVLNWFVRVDSVASPSRLARAFQVTGGAMTNTLKKLEARGLISIEPDQASGRSKVVRITEAGLQVRSAAISGIAPLLSEFAEHFSAAEIRQQTARLQQVRRYMDERRYR